MLSKIKSFFLKIKPYVFSYLKWLVLSLTVGSVCGAVGAAFSLSVSYVTGLRGGARWLIFLLPIGGLISVVWYKLLRVSGVGTNRVFDAVSGKTAVPVLLAPAVFGGSVLTHLFGGSAGREGAALQLGGSVASLFGRVFGLDDKTRRVLTLCGMGAVFSAVFGTPIGACVFALEVVCVGSINLSAVFPALISSLCAYGVAALLGAEPERFAVTDMPATDMISFIKVTVIAVLAAALSVLFCKALHGGEKLLKKYIPNEYLRIFAGGVLLVLLTLLVGTRDYNGGGIDVISRVFETGEVRYEAFLLKMLFTVITVSAGYKGGEIIPTLFIGAMFGAALAAVLGLGVGLGAAVGMAALFCGVTNCPLATVFLCCEMFGAEGILFYALSAVTSFLLSGKASLYASQTFSSEKTNAL